MTVSLGLDIGSNSVGSAWVDTEALTVGMAVSVFPPGVEESEIKRGNPVNQKRRGKRQQRRSIARRSRRKRRLVKVLVDAGLLPVERVHQEELWKLNPWHLRRKGLECPLSPYEFGRILVHLNQRRGVLGLRNAPIGEDWENGEQSEGKEDEYAQDERKVLAGLSHVRKEMKNRGARTFGEIMAMLYDERQTRFNGQADNKKPVCQAIRNRRDSFEFHADRALVHEEFCLIWQNQEKLGSQLASLLTKELRRQIDDPTSDETWRQKGELFGQRRIYWDTGTLGRCDLEPSDHRCPWIDRHAQEFRVLETVNNLRIQERDNTWVKLDTGQREKVLKALRTQKAGSIATIRNALEINKKSIKAFWRLNIEADEEREINTDWFYHKVVHGVFGETSWNALSEQQRESVNRALQKFDTDNETDAQKLRIGCQTWWGLSEEAAGGLVEVWRKRPHLGKRIKFSRRALYNLLPFLCEGLTVTEARQRFATPQRTDTSDQRQQRLRYALNATKLTKADRHYLRKHGVLPPAPMLSNPVVRKAIHEVRRHVLAWIRKYGRKPDRIVIEMVRSAKQPAKRRNEQLTLNRRRENVRKNILEQFPNSGSLTPSQQRSALDRVLLCRQQGGRCPYSEEPDEKGGISGWLISEVQAFEGRDVEIDHIVPYSRCGDNSLNNKVLCYRNSNRNKGSRTLREWLSHEDFGAMETRLSFMENVKPGSNDYFTKKDYAVKWEKLHSDTPAGGEWRGSQLTDTAYAAREVSGYLSDALYGEFADGKRRIFFTKGSYTSILRRDWQLFRQISNTGQAPGVVGEAGEKNRGDHRHHAIDAVVIALTDSQRLIRLAALAREQEEIRVRSERWPRREPVEPPWGTIREFRRQVLGKVFDTFQEVANDGETPANLERGTALIVSHRPLKRRLIGSFHKEDCYGAVEEEPGIFRIRCPVAALTPKMLRMPTPETDDQLCKRLTAEFKQAGITPGEARKKAIAMVARGGLRRRLMEPSPGKGGLVRDWNLRRIIRERLEKNGLNPDTFSTKQLMEFIQRKRLEMPSGVTIRSVITIVPISDPVKILVRDPATRKPALNSRTGTPLFRYHIGRNNHHVEIREEIQTGKWKAECKTMYQAVQRVRPAKNDEGKRVVTQAAVDRADRDDSRFVMSLAEGEMIHARRDDRIDAPPDYFVVVKLDGKRIWFAHHWDARKEGGDAAEIKQDRWDVSYSDLKECGPIPGTQPFKVVIHPAGNLRKLNRD